jgi:hypothetical protein
MAKAKKKSSFDELFSSDPIKATDGVPIPIGYNSKDEEIIFWIAEVNNKKHVAAQRKYLKMLETTRRNTKRNTAVLAKVLAEGILVKWKGILDENGEPIESTNDNKAKYLAKYDKLFQAVMEQSMNTDNYMLDDDEDDGEVTYSQEAQKDTEKN